MLFRGLLPLTKPGFTAVDPFVTQYYTKLVSNAFLIWMCWHKFSKYIPYKLSVNAWGLEAFFPFHLIYL